MSAARVLITHSPYSDEWVAIPEALIYDMLTQNAEDVMKLLVSGPEEAQRVIREHDIMEIGVGRSPNEALAHLFAKSVDGDELPEKVQVAHTIERLEQEIRELRSDNASLRRKVDISMSMAKMASDRWKRWKAAYDDGKIHPSAGRKE